MQEDVRLLKNELKRMGVQGLALDIDEVLSDTGPHWWRHMLNFHVPEGLSYQKLLEQYRFIEHVPGWDTDEAKEHIQTALASHEFTLSIPLLGDAQALVGELAKLVPVVAYATARNEVVRPATRAWLDRHGFPKVPLLMKTGQVGHHELAGKNSWKAGVLADLWPQVMGIVDDNPELLDALQKRDYQGTVYVFGTSFSGQYQVPNPSNYSFPVFLCPTWNHVLERFK